MGRRTGYWWSPGDRYIAVQRTDESPVGIVSRAAIGAAGTKVYDQRYPAAGTPNALVDLYVMKPDGSGKVKVDMGADPDRSEEHTSELQSLMRIPYAVFCLKKKKTRKHI